MKIEKYGIVALYAIVLGVLMYFIDVYVWAHNSDSASPYYVAIAVAVLAFFAVKYAPKVK